MDDARAFHGARIPSSPPTAPTTGPWPAAWPARARITFVEFALSELARVADRGEALDLKMLFLGQTLRLCRPDLFA